jgi:hypothetical protein
MHQGEQHRPRAGSYKNRGLSGTIDRLSRASRAILLM